MIIDRVLPYYKWFWQDWRANRKIQRMTYIEKGLYRELLDECWVEGFIPDDIEELADICGCPKEIMANAWQVLSKCFEVIEDGKLVNQKLHSLRTEKDVERLKKSENGKKGGIAKASAKHLPSNSHIEEKRREEKKKENNSPIGFDLFWNSYNKKVGKPNSIKAWAKINPDEELLKLIVQKALADAKAKPDSKFRKDPERWLKGQHWLDEVVIAQAPENKELPLGTNEQIEAAYRTECGDPANSRFQSYFEMRNFIVAQREKRKAA